MNPPTEIEKQIDAILEKWKTEMEQPVMISPRHKTPPPSSETLVERIKNLNGNYDLLSFDLEHDAEIIYFDDAEKLDMIAETLMRLSLRYKIETIEEELDEGVSSCVLYATMVESDDGTTNIDADVIQAFIDLARRIEQ